MSIFLGFRPMECHVSKIHSQMPVRPHLRLHWMMKILKRNILGPQGFLIRGCRGLKRSPRSTQARSVSAAQCLGLLMYNAWEEAQCPVKSMY
jgi:hypothetical protein